MKGGVGGCGRGVCVRLGSAGFSSIHERPQCKVNPSICPWAILTCVCVCFDLFVQAAACDSMTLLMKKLDHLNEGIQEVQSANSSHSDVANADEEQQSTTVSQVHLNQVKFDLFDHALNRLYPKCFSGKKPMNIKTWTKHSFFSYTVNHLHELKQYLCSVHCLVNVKYFRCIMWFYPFFFMVCRICWKGKKYSKGTKWGLKVIFILTTKTSQLLNKYFFALQQL